MKVVESNVEQEENTPEKLKKRKPYERPVLIQYGNIVRNTGGGSGVSGEGPPNPTKMP